MASTPVNDRRTYNRRGFVKVCVSSVAAVSANPALLARSGNAYRNYSRAKFEDVRGQTLNAETLSPGVPYIFHYPYITTPCFLINLGKSAATKTPLSTQDGLPYEWPGGVGANNSIVAFSAICAHKMSYPTRDVSFINYRHKHTAFLNIDEQPVKKSQVIYCCSERSVYDPAEGGRVLGGPAPQPLASVLLEHDPQDGSLLATGTLGADMFDNFFKSFEFRLALDHRITDVKRKVGDIATVYSMEEFSDVQIMC